MFFAPRIPRILALIVVCASGVLRASNSVDAFLENHCVECHDGDKKKGGLNLASLSRELSDPAMFGRWVKIYDRIEAGEMPPPEARAALPLHEKQTALAGLKSDLLRAEGERGAGSPAHSPIRRLTRTEFENTVRDLFSMPGIALRGDLPADGIAHGFDTNADALDLSHVNLAKYMEAADKILDMAVATRPTPPAVRKRRISLMNRGGGVAHVVMNGDGVLLRDGKPDPDFPASGALRHIEQGAHESLGSFETGASVGLFRHEDESLSPYFMEHVTIYPGLYRVGVSLWAFQWDRGKVLPARGTEAARLSVVQLTGDGRGGGHPSVPLGYFDAPSLHPLEHQRMVWLNRDELIGFNTASLAPVANYNRKDRAMGFTGPGIAVDWLEVEGPIHEIWPPLSHRLLFGNLPLREFTKENGRGLPYRPKYKRIGAGLNRPDLEEGLWSVEAQNPMEDAGHLLAEFLPQVFRRPVTDAEVERYLRQVRLRWEAGDCFETAMRWVYRAALCSPDFLYHSETQQGMDAHALANRLSYLLWRSLPDQRLRQLAASGDLKKEEVLHAEVERLLQDEKAERFIVDFLGQWLRLREISATDPDKKLYPEFSNYLKDSMVAETHAYFRELLKADLGAGYLIESDFVMLNEKLAVLYGIPGVSGSEIRRVALPPESVRGGFLAQAALLKVTANGTTTSPVLRGNFVTDRLLGRRVDPPPPNVPAVEPDVTGVNTIRELLAKHRADEGCAGCHARMDPPGFALEAFDVIGGYRERYRSLGEGDPAPRGRIDPFVPVSFRLAKPVDSSGALPDGRSFSDIRELRRLVGGDTRPLLRNVARRLAVFATGRPLGFSDRDRVEAIVLRTEARGGGLRTLLHELVQSDLFQGR